MRHIFFEILQSIIENDETVFNSIDLSTPIDRHGNTMMHLACLINPELVKKCRNMELFRIENLDNVKPMPSMDRFTVAMFEFMLEYIQDRNQIQKQSRLLINEQKNFIAELDAQITKITKLIEKLNG